jgi:hypothetical protein
MRIAILVVASVLACTTVFRGQTTAPPPARQSEQGPSLQETLDYVTSKIDRAKFPDWKIYLSSDHEKIMQGGTAGGWVRSMEVNVMSVVEKNVLSSNCVQKSAECFWESGFSVIGVGCTSYSPCTEECISPAARQAEPICNKGGIEMRFPGYPLDDESQKRLVKAYTHLVDLLQVEYRAKHDKDDPFAK